MARYAPLPSIPLDPKNEAEIVQAASQKVYQASNQTLNDFSSGNPLAALLEGQAFAQGEFLFWANQLPQSILTEWIGPFLGAMRKLGTPATARLLVSVPPSSAVTIIPAGTAFTTDPNLTGGELFTFISDSEVPIPSGESTAFITVVSQYVGSIYNSPANSITGVGSVNVSGLTVTNPQPAVGGSDVETFQEVQERFFTLIRRPNPVSSGDWQDFFTDFYGAGTLTSVQPNRPNQGTYNYLTDYLKPNGQVSFFVLGPDGVELNQTQLERGQNVVNYSVPVENQGHLYPLTLSQVQYNINLEINANGQWGADLRSASLNFRDRLFEILRPGNIFPPTIDPTVSDVDAAFYSTFGTDIRFSDPHVTVSAAYNTPPLLEPEAATYTQVYTFEPTEELLNKGDLVEITLPISTYYPVDSSFTPYSTAKEDQTIYGNLQLQQIKYLAAGEYLKGQICYWAPSIGGDDELHVILENQTIGSQLDISGLIATGKISGAMTYSPWVVNNNYQETTVTGVYAPEIIEYDYASPIVDNVDIDGHFVPPGTVTLNKRPGAFAWIVSNNFTLQPATNDVTGAQTAFLLGSSIVPQELQTGLTYAANTWVYTPQVGSGPNPVADPYYNYVDPTVGVVNKYALVISTFTYEPSAKTVSVYFDQLVEQGIVREIVVEKAEPKFDHLTGLTSFKLPIYKYKPRFAAGTYLLYKDLDSCQAAHNLSAPVTEVNILSQGNGYVDGIYPNQEVTGGTGFGAKATAIVLNGGVVSVILTDNGFNYRAGDVCSLVKYPLAIFELESSTTQYYIAASYFTPNSTNSQDLVNEGLIFPLYTSNLQYLAFVETLQNKKLKEPTRMFRFFKGDRTFFRQGSQVVSYTATTNVHPLFEFYIYLENGIFVETARYLPNNFETQQYIPYFDPAYIFHSEDTILSEDGRNLYRVMKAFVPNATATSWSGVTVTNTTRIEEYEGNLLRYVDKYECEESILSQLGRDISAIKLGVCQITLIPKDKGRFTDSQEKVIFVWENTATLNEIPQLSWYSGSTYPYTPPTYGDGTLRL